MSPITTLILSFVVATPNGWALEVFRAGAVLPSGRSNVRTVYDGLDSIYVMGGSSANTSGHGTYYDSILMYNFISDEISQVGRLTSNISNGGAGRDRHRNFYYFGGSSYGACSSMISRFYAESPNPGVIGGLPRPVHGFATASDNMGNFYLVSGLKCGSPPQIDEIVYYNSTLNQSHVTGYLPQLVYLSSSAAVWVNSAVYIFGGFNFFSYTTEKLIVKFSPNSGISEILNATLPFSFDSHSAVEVDGDVYIVGGASFDYEGHHLTKFRPSDNTVEVIDVVNFPDVLISASAVFVAKMGRIYIFGGNTVGSGTDVDEILYIQL